jgi:hypothetical protein
VKFAGIHCRDGGSFHGRLNTRAIVGHRRPLLVLLLVSAGGISEVRLRFFSDVIEEALEARVGDSARELILTVWRMVDAVSVRLRWDMVNRK